MDNENLKNLIQQGIKDFMTSGQYNLTRIQSHAHNGTDTSKITVVDLPIQTPIKLGLGGMISTSGSFRHLNSPESPVETITTAIVAGRDQAGTVGITTENLQFNLEHYPNDPNHFSFIDAFRPPLLSIPPDTTISVNAGGNTMTINNYGLVVNAYANALINIYDSAANLVETQVIASNTSSVITITGTWLNTTTNGFFFIFVPVFLGRNLYPWQRLYVMDGTGGGVRFGPGPTAGGQNGLLYMDATGDLYWRNKTGTSTKLN